MKNIPTGLNLFKKNFEKIAEKIHVNFDATDTSDKKVSAFKEETVTYDRIEIVFVAQFTADLYRIQGGDYYTEEIWDYKNEDITVDSIYAYYKGDELPITQIQKEQLENKIKTNYTI